MNNSTNLFGGYQMVDLKELNLLEAEETQSRPGLYAKLQRAIKNNKPVVAYNCIWGTGKPVTPTQVYVYQVASDSIIATLGTLQIVVSAADVVTINNLVS